MGVKKKKKNNLTKEKRHKRGQEAEISDLVVLEKSFCSIEGQLDGRLEAMTTTLTTTTTTTSVSTIDEGQMVFPDGM